MHSPLTSRRAGVFCIILSTLGMNDDGQGRRVFDGVLRHVAGAGKVFANHRFGMPARTATQHEDRLYPPLTEYPACRWAHGSAASLAL
jgi:hypothetical protein